MKLFIEKKPLLFLLILAFAVRLVAVFFAKGYMMHDDHFLTVEPSASWADGFNFNEWAPGIGNDRESPEPISFFYLGFLFVFFKGLNFLGIENPDHQMYVIRFIHALYSLLTIYFSYKITERISNKKNEFQVGLLLSLLAVMPNYSVRNLVEFVSMPPLLLGVWILLRNNAFKIIHTRLPFGNASLTLQPDFGSQLFISKKWLVLAAFVMGLAVGLRYQTVLVVAFTGVILLLQKEFRNFIVFGLVAFAAFFLTQIDDLLLWGGKPFQHLMGYFGYNAENALNYPGSWATYLSFIGYIILPPVSLMLLFGFFKEWKRSFFIFLPVLIFVVFHIIYPNRQERFIFPILPFFIMLGVMGWNRFVEQSTFWSNRRILYKTSWTFFWILNIVGMLVLSTTYSKRARVEAMLYLYDKGDCKNFIQDFRQGENGSLVPQFYSGTWDWYYVFRSSSDYIGEIKMMESWQQQQANTIKPKSIPNYILFYNDDRLQERVDALKVYFPNMSYETKIEAGWFDVLLHTLNDKNSLETIYIYKIN